MLPTIEGAGYTGPGMPYADSTGRRPAGLALLHGNEYVVPEDLLFGNPWVADQVAIIESLRTGGRSFAAGGPAGSMPGHAAGEAMEMVKAVERRLQGIELALARLDKPMRAYFTPDEGRAFDAYMAQHETNRESSEL
jgi:hypothetical protein